MLYYFEKGKNATETQKKNGLCMEKVLWLIKHVKSGLQKTLEICAGDFHWTIRHGGVNQVKLIKIKSRQ